jgi:GntR family transcriptional regulator
VDPKQILVTRAIPTDPADRASESLYLSEAGRQGVAAERRMLEVGPMPAPQVVAERMGVPAGLPVLLRRRLMFAAGVPVRIANSYFLLPLAKDTALEDADFIPGGLQELFKGMGIQFGRAEETLVARLPTDGEVELLRIDPAEPVVELLRTSYSRGGEPIHTLQTICAATRHIFSVNQLPSDEAF